MCDQTAIASCMLYSYYSTANHLHTSFCNSRCRHLCTYCWPTKWLSCSRNCIQELGTMLKSTFVFNMCQQHYVLEHFITNSKRAKSTSQNGQLHVQAWANSTIHGGSVTSNKSLCIVGQKRFSDYNNYLTETVCTWISTCSKNFPIYGSPLFMYQKLVTGVHSTYFTRVSNWSLTHMHVGCYNSAHK